MAAVWQLRKHSQRFLPIAVASISTAGAAALNPRYDRGLRQHQQHHPTSIAVSQPFDNAAVEANNYMKPIIDEMSTYPPSPLTSRSPSPDTGSRPEPDTVKEKPDKGECSLSQRLDVLLASYLELLDTYTILRAQISKEFSSGFIALAQANRNSTLGPGRRYGEEGYDDRMKALRTVQIERSRVGPPAENPLQYEDGESGQPSDLAAAGQHKGKRQRLSIGEDGLKNESTTTKRGEIDDKESDPSSTHPIHNMSHLVYTSTTSITNSPLSTPSKDPLKWYGILVPSPLRQCQTHFQSSVVSTIPALLNTISALQRLEEEIWGVRRELGILREYEHRLSDSATSTEYSRRINTEGGEHEGPSHAQSSLASFQTQPSKPIPSAQSPPKISSLPYRSPSSPSPPSELRSRVLKLD
ncbi:uncharacterized protein Z518_05585 [Rhinocladiella mackenziei CBS 650.93]|uniref:Vacuolar ATPase assembly protein VMA22 n=1 Tax=Rhinocladiella mackenziei CBS 650.93 TaxID=1442369 RepID=A0A0D2J6N5_9EURO|nr:uncharacterized protein Z518_05585 [Rhinocladiella mackenziei CBS 650.93]KIX04715.1 hypothetical protein Z518_05585 [Rhinocladiella mackenziei CBS 650.93]